MYRTWAYNARTIELLDLGHDISQDTCIAVKKPDEELISGKPSACLTREALNCCSGNAGDPSYLGDNLPQPPTITNADSTCVGVQTGDLQLRSLLLKTPSTDHLLILETSGEFWDQTRTERAHA